ncbi:MAG: hypothetical protein OEW75_15875 [Cyclobacteriaceae bacterium]|nr:hypothetical protein [Cyclobacteriaceae bacterium]
MKSSILLSACLFIFLFSLQAQKQIEHQDFDSWKRIRNEQISNNGKYVVYHLAPGKGDQILKISSHEGKELLSYTRGESSRFTFDSKYVIFTIKPGLEVVNEFRRKKTKPEDMPKDSLAIFNLQTEQLTKIGNVKSWKVPEKWNGYVVYQSASLPSDTSTVNTDKKAKKINQENGFPLLIHNLSTGVSDSIEFVTDYQLARENDKLIYTTSGVPGKLGEGVYFSDISDKTSIPLLRAKGVFKSLTFDNKGDQVAFLCDLDTTKALVRDFQLRYWSLGMDSAQLKVNTSTSGMQDHWMVSEHGILRFSDNATMLFFGTTPFPVLQDTSRLSEEIINVEVWHYKDKRLYTQQNVELKKDKMKNYQAVFHILSNKMVQLADEEVSQIKTTFNWDAMLVMGFSDLRYQREFSWEGWSKDDLYLIDIQTGSKKLIKEGVQGFSNLSSGGNYINWFDQTDSTYYAYHIASGKINNLSSAIKTSLVEELHDSPILPYPYGFAGNTKNDEAILIYDRYDIWSLDPQNQKAPIRLTQGRESTFRSGRPYY